MFDKAVMCLPGSRRMFWLLAGLTASRAVLTCFQAWGLASAVTGLWNGGGITRQFTWILVFFISFVGRKAVWSIQDKAVFHYAQEQAHEIRHSLLRKIFHLGSRLTQQSGSGNVITMLLDGMEQVETYIRLTLAKITGMMLIPAILLAMTFVLDWVSGLILLAVLPLIIVFMVLLGHTASDRAKQQYQSFQLLSNHFIDSLRGIDTLKYFGLGKQHGSSIFTASERLREATIKTLRVAFLSSFALDFFCTLSVAIVAVGLGLRLLDGAILLLPALTVLILSPEYFLPIRDFAGNYHATLDGKNAMAAVINVLDLPEPAEEKRVIPAWDENSSLDVGGLTFAYPECTALKDIGFAARGFQKIGVIGMSGSGKTTLLNLLAGFAAPDAGSIRIDSRPFGSLHIPDWQKQVIYIPQHPYIFRASLRDNVAFYYPAAKETEILAAIQTTGLQELLAELPDGLDTQIGEGARPLSGGQAQRVALARALLDQNRRILLFDEPTAHLDIETEVELKEKMLPLMNGRLVFFATHRLHWMRDMDHILVLEDGRIAETGSLAELLAKNRAYARLARLIREGEE